MCVVCGVVGSEVWGRHQFQGQLPGHGGHRVQQEGKRSCHQLSCRSYIWCTQWCSSQLSRKPMIPSGWFHAVYTPLPRKVWFLEKTFFIVLPLLYWPGRSEKKWNKPKTAVKRDSSGQSVSDKKDPASQVPCTQCAGYKSRACGSCDSCWSLLRQRCVSGSLCEQRRLLMKNYRGMFKS